MTERYIPEWGTNNDDPDSTWSYFNGPDGAANRRRVMSNTTDQDAGDALDVVSLRSDAVTAESIGGSLEPVEILTKRVGFPAEVVGEFLPHPDEPHPWRRSFVIIHPADSEDGRRQIDAMAEVLFRDEHRRYEPLDDWHDTTARARDMWRRKARAVLDALMGQSDV